jgi:hypothetical protein
MCIVHATLGAKIPQAADTLVGQLLSFRNGGREIRTLGTPIRRTTVFETAAFNRSATPPGRHLQRLDDRVGGRRLEAAVDLLLLVLARHAGFLREMDGFSLCL